MRGMLTDPAGETVYGSAEGATAPETLRHKGPQDLMALWKAGFLINPTDGVSFMVCTCAQVTIVIA